MSVCRYVCIVYRVDEREMIFNIVWAIGRWGDAGEHV